MLSEFNTIFCAEIGSGLHFVFSIHLVSLRPHVMCLLSTLLKVQNLRYRSLLEFLLQRRRRPFLPLLPKILFRQKAPVLR